MTLDPIAPAQSILYRFLAEGFSLPTAERLAYLAEMTETVRAACEEMVESGEAAALPDLDRMEQAVREAVRSDLGELQAEYTRLYVTGIPVTPCRLLESVQREGALVGEAADQVTGAYREFGLEAQEREPDHLVTELEFLVYLTGTPVAEGDEAERYARAHTRFLQEHLLQWAPAIERRTRESTEEPLFLSLATLLGWVATAGSAR